MVRLTVVEMPMAQGLGFTAMRSGTGMGVEVSTSGGSLRGKKTSWMLSHRVDPDGFLLKGFAHEGIEKRLLSGRTAAASEFESACGIHFVCHG